MVVVMYEEKEEEEEAARVGKSLTAGTSGPSSASLDGPSRASLLPSKLRPASPGAEEQEMSGSGEEEGEGRPRPRCVSLILAREAPPEIPESG